MPSRSPSPSARRVTLAEVARDAGVSLMTVSYAMRNHPKIPPRTRVRIQRLARRLGYVPNPEIGRLMHLLRAGRLPSYQATLAFLSFYEGGTPPTHRYTSDLIAGAKARALELGYAVDIFSLARNETSPARLTSMLRSRGIRGILIPPLPGVLDCRDLLDWSQFTAIAATYSAQNLAVNRVMPHHLNNVFRALHHLERRGYQRVGLMLTGDLVHRANFAYQAAVALRQQAGQFASIPAFTAASIHDSGFEPRVRAWLKGHRPEVILTVESTVAYFIRLLGARYPAETGLCVLDHSRQFEVAGIDQHAGLIGRSALELLAGQLQHGEPGLGHHPRVTMVEGTWIDGPSLRGRLGRR